MMEKKRTDCPALPPGWKKEEVIRKSGLSAGKSDVYYYSPTGKKFRSKPQLSRYLGNKLDLACFDFRTGKMMPGKMQKNKQRFRHDPLSLAKGTGTESVPGQEESGGGADGRRFGAGRRKQPGAAGEDDLKTRQSSSVHQPQVITIFMFIPTTNQKQTLQTSPGRSVAQGATSSTSQRDVTLDVCRHPQTPVIFNSSEGGAAAPIISSAILETPANSCNMTTNNCSSDGCSEPGTRGGSAARTSN
ncbi:methyl-CpG-binding domain protein 2 isoform X2 [Embiotoca jacksoni]|uniref:methyl-CpG-binding domain protein 2 isoform X2 n=1 Tax=Embiotoca jacksoni TaxID=100190 RepID=UPI003704C227